MVFGMLVAFAGAWIAGVISGNFPNNPGYRNLVRFGIAIGLRNQKGYLRPVADDADPNNPANWEYEDGQVRAVSYTFIVVVAYCIITGRQIAPLVAGVIWFGRGSSGSDGLSNASIVNNRTLRGYHRHFTR
jgi:hypothetical protein